MWLHIRYICTQIHTEHTDFQLYFSIEDTEQRQFQSPPVKSTHHIFYYVRRESYKLPNDSTFSQNSSSLLAVNTLTESNQLIKLKLFQISGHSDMFELQFENQTKIQMSFK